MKVKTLKVGDRLLNKRLGVVYRIIGFTDWSGGNGEISFEELRTHRMIGEFALRKRMMTYKQFERFRYLRRERSKT